MQEQIDSDTVAVSRVNFSRTRLMVGERAHFVNDFKESLTLPLFHVHSMGYSRLQRGTGFRFRDFNGFSAIRAVLKQMIWFR